MKNALLVEGLNIETPHANVENFFSCVGPVKKCFQWQGFWLVDFGLPRDAKKATKTCQKFADEKPIRLHGNVTRRLILRNLPFDITVENLKEFCTKAGIVMSAQLMKGFGFVQYVTHTQAKKVRLLCSLLYSYSQAIETLNATEFRGRTIVADWALPKTIYQADSNDADKKAKSKEESEDEEQQNSSDAEMIDVGVSDDEEESEQEPEEPKVSLKAEVTDGSTLFIRNLAFETSQEDLHELYALSYL
jgi:RNA recognition motif-containing protein